MKTCSCGNNRTSPYVIRKNQYTFWGKVGLFTGISVKPIHIRYQCVRCKEIFDETTDPGELNKYIMEGEPGGSMHKIVIFACAGLLGISACAKSTTDRTTAREAVVSESVESQISAINNATSDVNTGNTTAISSLAPAEQRFLESETLMDKMRGFFGRIFDSSLHAIAFSCSTGSVGDSGQQFGTSAAFTVTRQWTSCTGDAGLFRRNGNVYLGWTNLSTTGPYVQNTTVLKRATSGLTMTRVATGNYVEISGNDAGNQVSSTNGNQVLTWTSVAGANRTFTLAINETRTGKTAGGTTFFQHTITTPTILTINVDTGAGTRTIASGTIRVQHVLAGFNVDTTFSSAVWNIASCQPVSGSATVTVSGSRSGTGTITFSSGTASFSYGGETGAVVVPGC
jgi:hypothetical protein